MSKYKKNSNLKTSGDIISENIDYFRGRWKSLFFLRLKLDFTLWRKLCSKFALISINKIARIGLMIAVI